MRTAVIASGVGVAVVLLLAWVTWSFMFSPVDRVFVMMLLGIGGVGGQ